MTDRFNTIAGWILFSLIVGWGLSSLSEHLFRADKPEMPEKPGYTIVAAEPTGGADAGPPLATLLASASPDAGKAIFAKCGACHTIDQGAPNGIGPNLYGVIGEPIGKGKAGFAFSSALSGKGGNWTYDDLNTWLTSPRGFAPGTKMSFAGLSKPEDRANVIMYLHSMGGGPPLPTAPAADAAAAPGGADDAAAPGKVEGEAKTPADAAGATGSDKPVASTNAPTGPVQ